MFDLGALELILVFLIILFVIGPKEIPNTFLMIGRSIRRFKLMWHKLNASVHHEMREAGIKEDLDKLLSPVEESDETDETDETVEDNDEK